MSFLKSSKLITAFIASASLFATSSFSVARVAAQLDVGSEVQASYVYDPIASGSNPVTFGSAPTITVVDAPVPELANSGNILLNAIKVTVTRNQIILTANNQFTTANPNFPASQFGPQFTLAINSNNQFFKSATLVSAVNYNTVSGSLITQSNLDLEPLRIRLNFDLMTGSKDFKVVINFTTGRKTPGGQVIGDPQFQGFMGQSYQVHGTADTDYNIISSESLQYNAHFTYLSEGKCRAGTICFAHPGNYFGKVGILIKTDDSKVVKLKVASGSVDDGMKITVDGNELSPSDKTIKIDSSSSLVFNNKFELLLQTSEWTIRLQNSDKFLNQQISIGESLKNKLNSFKSLSSSASESTKQQQIDSLPHGILGQTWRRVEYSNRWKFIEGDLMNYIVSDIMSVPTEFNRFQIKA